MKRKYQATVVFLMLCFCSHAQNILKGKVTDALTHQPLEAVSLIINSDASARTVTDEMGNFYLSAAFANKDSVIISCIGYRTIILSATSIEKKPQVELQPSSVNLKDLVLQAGTSSRFNMISKIDLNLKPVRNTQELLRLVPGLFIAQHAGGGKAEQIFLRGFDCDHGTDVAVSVDGIPVNMVSHAHGQGYADAHFIIPETISNIDFGTGPYYADKGNLNTAGYVSFSTFKTIPKSMVQLEAGRFNTYRALAMIDLLKKDKRKQSAWMAGEISYSDGPTEHPQNFNRINLFGKFNIIISNNTSFSVSSSFFKSKWDASGQVPGRAIENGTIGRFGSIDPTEGGNTERFNTNLLLSHHYSNGSAWDNQFFYSRYLFNLYSDFTFYLNDPVNGDEINQAEQRNLFGYLSKFSQKNQLGSFSVNSSYAAGFRYDATNNSRLSHVVARQFLDDIKKGNIREMNSYAFMQHQLSKGNWLIDAGIRFDHFNFAYHDKLNAQQLPSQQHSIISPKLNVQYTVNDAVRFYIKAGKGFHSNDTRVVVANDGKEILPAAYGTDLGIILKPVKNLYLNIALWQLYLDQEFVYVGDDGNIEPSGRTKRQGIDIIARYQLGKYIFINTNINLTKPRSRDEAKGNDFVPLAPVMTSTGGLFYKKKEGFNGSISYRYIKDRPANEDNSIIAKGYCLLDASVNYTKPGYEIGIAMENIFNIKWNEAQFATESRLMNEPAPVTELNFTPGSPFFARMKLALFF